ncbi:DUF29 domain-containing protein [Cyanothece sp. BG0011]|uniref:DUF29 domain-containing protein n=1 Tax=Cyanothece sp. BG0011 TaxID=2082950 RepID=UPI000D1F39A4|nr:DUF29 domain-containing protein [Cyanothece sp. BG0011]
MTSIITSKLLYEQDLNLWLLTTIEQLKQGDLNRLDIEHLIEELEGLAGRDRRELESRLEVLLSHLLKRLFVPSPNDYRGWELTIKEQRNRLQRLLKQSPSLRNYFISVFSEIYEDAYELVSLEYTEVNFPKVWPYSQTIEDILLTKFWEE